MSRPLLALLTLTFALTGCATLSTRDRDLLQDHGVSAALSDKMAHHEPLTLDDIIELSHRGVPGPFIVHYLRPTYVAYKLSPNDATRLRQQGVAEGVMRYLQATPAMYSPSNAPLWYEDDPQFHDPYWDYRRY
ncbi:MAG: hypothetical protein ABJF10_27685 [Chthoniobacter sp.]|uniref:hypothetical protein n=1 Tax=Chthoniobacter sp. TaxID=2510640 RepID=UPI0032AA03EB